jgi:SAM-dependent methyltransferase
MTFGSNVPGNEPVERAAGYDRFVNWDRRLKREAPLFRREFAAHDVHRVIDVGTGSGMHAAMWARWGLDVVGVDPDAAMLEQARSNAATTAAKIAVAGGSLHFVTGAFGELGSLKLGTADALTCTGNALPHVEGAEALVPVLRDDDDGTWVFLRVMDYVEGGILFDFITLHRPAGDADAPWETISRRSLHTALPSATLLAGLEEAGFRNVAFLGSHDGVAFRPDADESVIVTAVRGWRGRAKR